MGVRCHFGWRAPSKIYPNYGSVVAAALGTLDAVDKQVGFLFLRGCSALKRFLYFLKGFPADDSLMSVVDVVLVTFPVVPHGFVGERVCDVFLLKEAVPNVPLIGKDVPYPVDSPWLPIPWVDTLAV